MAKPRGGSDTELGTAPMFAGRNEGRKEARQEGGREREKESREGRERKKTESRETVTQ